MDPQLLFIEGMDKFQIKKVEEQAKKAGIEFKAYWEREGTLSAAMSTDKTGIIAAIIHLSDLDTFWAKEVIATLPQEIRRIAFSEATNTAKIVKKTAIGLNVDWILTPNDFWEDPDLIRKIVERGWATPEEIEQRGKTIEINGQREGNTIWPERDDMHGPRDYRDEDYIAKAKKGEKD